MRVHWSWKLLAPSLPSTSTVPGPAFQRLHALRLRCSSEKLLELHLSDLSTLITRVRAAPLRSIALGAWQGLISVRQLYHREQYSPRL
jgi:hypothetical protein